MKLKTFPVTEIVTTDDGRVILNGPKGSIDVRRLEKHSSAARFKTRYPHEMDNPGTTHVVKVDEIPTPGPDLLRNGIAF